MTTANNAEIRYLTNTTNSKMLTAKKVNQTLSKTAATVVTLAAHRTGNGWKSIVYERDSDTYTVSSNATGENKFSYQSNAIFWYNDIKI